MPHSDTCRDWWCSENFNLASHLSFRGRDQRQFQRQPLVSSFTLKKYNVRTRSKGTLFGNMLFLFLRLQGLWLCISNPDLSPHRLNASQPAMSLPVFRSTQKRAARRIPSRSRNGSVNCCLGQQNLGIAAFAALRVLPRYPPPIASLSCQWFPGQRDRLRPTPGIWASCQKVSSVSHLPKNFFGTRPVDNGDLLAGRGRPSATHPDSAIVRASFLHVFLLSFSQGTWLPRTTTERMKEERIASFCLRAGCTRTFGFERFEAYKKCEINRYVQSSDTVPQHKMECGMVGKERSFQD